jgi:hypothetical protein
MSAFTSEADIHICPSECLLSAISEHTGMALRPDGLESGRDPELAELVYGMSDPETLRDLELNIRHDSPLWLRLAFAF